MTLDHPESIGISSLLTPYFILECPLPIVNFETLDQTKLKRVLVEVIFPRISLRGCTVNRKVDISSVFHSPYVSHSLWA